jgi:hypothetical protein
VEEPLLSVRQIEIRTAESLVPDPNYFKIETTIAKLNNYKQPGSHQISTQLIQVGSEILRSDFHSSLILFIHSFINPVDQNTLI